VGDDRKTKVLLVCDTPGHTAGYHVVARGLRDGGIEVVLTGAMDGERIAETALQEEVGCIGYRIMDRDPVIMVTRLLKALRQRHLEDIPLVVGGIIPQSEVRQLRELGVQGIFGPGSRLDEIVSFVREHASRQD
jgi:methylmalonyl-CoA mutase C-terminal domain/subunit